MRVLHWYPNFLGGGAVASAVYGLALSQSRLGAVVAIATASSSSPPLYGPLAHDSGITIIEWRPRGTVHLHGSVLRFLPPQTARHLRTFRPDVVHVHGELNADNLWVSHIFDGPVVLSPHGGFHPVVFSKGRRLTKYAYFRLARWLLYRNVHAFHALSPAEAEHLRVLLPDAFVYCVPQGSNLCVPHAAQILPRSQHHVRFVFVGRLDVFTKGLDLLLKAFAALARWDAKNRASLTLVGPEWRGSRQELEKLIKELGITDRVQFTGALPGEQVALALAHADIYVQLSRHDGFPLSLVEALLARKPSIVSQAVGTVSYPEIARLPHVRIVAPAVEEAALAMADFSRCVDELRLLAERFHADVREFFSWERIAKAQLCMYESVAANGVL